MLGNNLGQPCTRRIVNSPFDVTHRRVDLFVVSNEVEAAVKFASHETPGRPPPDK